MDKNLKEVFKGVKFRKYAYYNDIEAVYKEAIELYELHADMPGIDGEFKKIQLKFLKQVDKHLTHGHAFGVRFKDGTEIKFDDRAPERRTWNNLFNHLWERNKGACCLNYDTVEKLLEGERVALRFYGRRRFMAEEYKTLIPALKYVLAQCSDFNTEPEYQRAARILKGIQVYVLEYEEATREGKILYEEFKLEFSKYFKEKKVEYAKAWREWYKEQKAEEDQWDRTWNQYVSRPSRGCSAYFTGCGSKLELKKKYRELAMKLHPDRGGDEEEFKAMKAEYDSCMMQYK